MRHGTSNSRRQRGRGNGGGQQGGGNARRGNSQRAQVFDSNGPDVRIRGTAHQVAEKYLTLARDAASAGDRIVAESYLQHAEHYQRIISSWDEGVQERPAQSAKSAEKQEKRAPKNAPKETDLSLPSSILGAPPKVEPEVSVEGRTAEVVAS